MVGISLAMNLRPGFLSLENIPMLVLFF